MRGIFKEFQKIGKLMQDFGLITSHAGNLSIRKDHFIFITRHGSMLSELTSSDIIKVPLEKKRKGASFELPVHQQIYANTSANAIMHAHPVHAIILSWFEDMIKPMDSEGKIILKDIPVLKCKITIGSAEVSSVLCKAFARYKIAVVREHGSFAIGNDLEETLCYTSALEASSKMIIYREILLRIKNIMKK